MMCKREQPSACYHWLLYRICNLGTLWNRKLKREDWSIRAESQTGFNINSTDMASVPNIGDVNHVYVYLGYINVFVSDPLPSKIDADHRCTIESLTAMNTLTSVKTQFWFYYRPLKFIYVQKKPTEIHKPNFSIHIFSSIITLSFMPFHLQAPLWLFPLFTWFYVTLSATNVSGGPALGTKRIPTISPCMICATIGPPLCVEPEASLLLSPPSSSQPCYAIHFVNRGKGLSNWILYSAGDYVMFHDYVIKS